MDESTVSFYTGCCLGWSGIAVAGLGDDVLDGDSRMWGIGMANMLIREMRGLRGSVLLVGIRVGDP